MSRSSLLLLLLAVVCPAQSQDPALVERDTERWIVHFKTRSFDLGAFRKAIHDRQPQDVVARIVEDLERKVVADQEAFTRTVETRFDARVLTRWWLINACLIEVNARHVRDIRALPNVLRLQRDQEAVPHIQRSTNSKNHNSDAVQKAGETGKGVCVAILDSGQDEKMGSSGRPHRTYFVGGDPKDTTGGGIGGSRLVVNQKIGSMPADDVTGHGTGVASVAAGANWGTTAADHGHAFSASIAGYSIAESSGGSSKLATMASAWQQVAKDRAKYNIVAGNISYSGHFLMTSVEQLAMDSAAYNADILITTSAGNFGNDARYSQSCANGLAVGAVSADSHVMWSNSTNGPLPSPTSRLYPDLAACGVSVVTAAANNEGSNRTFTGTSVSAPQVCGIAALVRAANAKLTALETKAILLASSQSIERQNPGKNRNYYGMGLARADLAVQLAKGNKNFGTAKLTSTQKTVSIPLAVTKGKQYAVCIAWHRSQFPSTKPVVYSNLDFRILEGTNLVDESKTPLNLYEMVRFMATKTGTYILEVTGTSLDVATVPFSWAFTETPPAPVVGAAAAFGKGCKGTGAGGVPALSARAAPVIAKTFTVDVAGGLESALAMLLVGLSNSTWSGLQLPWTAAPGCQILVSGDLLVPMKLSPTGSVTVNVKVPNNTSLLGVIFYEQVGVLDPKANAFGYAMTNALWMRVGDT